MTQKDEVVDINTHSIENDSQKCEHTNDLCQKMMDDEKIDLAAARILEKYRVAFEELAK